MDKNELVTQAQYIFQQSTLVRDYIFQRSMNNARKNMDHNTYKELTMAQYIMFMVIDEHGPLTITDLANILKISNPSASAMVEKLVSKKIITRKQSQEDRRKVMVQISPQAAKRIAEMKQVALGSFIDLVKKVGPKTTRKWREVLDEINRAIEELAT